MNMELASCCRFSEGVGGVKQQPSWRCQNEHLVKQHPYHYQYFKKQPIIDDKARGIWPCMARKEGSR